MDASHQFTMKLIHIIRWHSGRARSYADATDLTARSNEHPPLLAAPSNVEENLDVVQAVSDLNCHGFDSDCRWSNTDEDELDWTVLLSTPQAEPLVSALHTTRLPDASAAVLLSGGRSISDGGQLVSDLLPCIIQPLQLTATVWRSSSDGPFQQQPNLQICSRNSHADQFYSNCNQFPIQNGIPVTADIPTPRDPTAPAQIVLLGDNFVSKSGGAIFVQDIIVDGELVPDCTITVPFATVHINKPQKQQHQTRHLIPLHNFRDSSTNNVVEGEQLDAKQKISNLSQPSKLHFASSSLADSLIVQCLKLSCSPVGKTYNKSAENDCGWQKDIAGWMISTGTDGFSNPLTGIMAPPVGINSFLVASYNGDSKNSIRQIISPPISIPTSAQPIYFCFYEYFALEGARFTMCTNEFDKGCFYSKTDIPKDGHLQVVLNIN
uniref:MAM domain-containing protein n=1 Tax=Elaeophora elaphi TaxID=1147741 RepID=A0A0R3RML1_9BILA